MQQGLCRSYSSTASIICMVSLYIICTDLLVTNLVGLNQAEDLLLIIEQCCDDVRRVLIYLSKLPFSKPCKVAHTNLDAACTVNLHQTKGRGLLLISGQCRYSDICPCGPVCVNEVLVVHTV